MNNYQEFPKYDDLTWHDPFKTIHLFFQRNYVLALSSGLEGTTLYVVCEEGRRNVQCTV